MGNTEMKRMILFLTLLSVLLALGACEGQGTSAETGTESVTSSAAVSEAATSEQEPEAEEPAKIRVLTQNLRSGNDSGGNSIRERQPRFRELMAEYTPDLVGTQETTWDWLLYLKRTFGEEYSVLGCSREGKDATSGEWNAILYKADRFELLDSDTFWLTSTPEKVSAVNGSKCKRICTWALLKDTETGATLVFCNTHLDHSNNDIRNQQAQYLISGLQEYIGKYPVILTGDFNASNSTTPYKTITSTLKDSHWAAKKKSSGGCTFHNYGASSSEIDFVFFDDAFLTAEQYYVVKDDFGGYVSDHYGVWTDFSLKSPETGA